MPNAAAPARPPLRLGMIAPSSNTVLEPATARLLPPDGPISVHVSRFRVTQISASDASRAQFAFAGILDAADLLADALVDLIVWNGTAASWLGFERDRDLAAAITARTGTPATTALLAVNAALQRIGARRIGLVTPYIAELETAIIGNYRGIGVDTVAAERLDLTVNTDYAAVPPETIATMTRRVAAGGPDAVVIMCTNLAGAGIAPKISAELGLPVLDSVRVTVEHCRDRLLGILAPPSS